VTVDCGALTPTLVASELFGHERSAFTGAERRHLGAFERADGGTLFLDEVAEMDLALQGKFLRVLQDKEFTPVGESKPRRADVRIVAATNKELFEKARAGDFREDLFYRLNVLPIHVPALRERRDDIKLLTRSFVAQANERHQRRVTGVDERVEQVFAAYPWPGNIRELANLVERLVILKGEGAIQPTDLPAGMAHQQDPAQDFEQVELPESGLNIKEAMERLEARLTTEALRRSNGNKARAAEMLGLKRTTLIERLKRLDIPDL
jgi:transcriptional regulator with PAS, ATPase and Fis domain